MVSRAFFLFCLSCLSAIASPIPAALEQALKDYRAEGAPFWAFTQTTVTTDTSLVERFDPSKPEFSRWTLLQKNNAAPSPATLDEYRDRLSRRTNGTAPNIRDQIDPSSCSLVREDEARAVYRFRLKPGARDDHSAEHMEAFFTLHKPSGSIEEVCLASTEPFSPMFFVRVSEAKTVILYSIPSPERPALLQKVTVHMRGRVMWFKSLDSDMTVSFSDHAFVGKSAAIAENPSRANPTAP